MMLWRWRKLLELFGSNSDDDLMMMQVEFLVGCNLAWA